MDSTEDTQPPRVPPELYSDYEGRPFRSCTRCGESLQDFEGGFQISKAYRNGECVMEYALCDHCRGAMFAEFSDESKQKLGRFQEEQVHLERGFNHCAVCGTSRDDGPMKEFVMTGLCNGNQLHHGMLVCGECGDAVQGLISAKTRDTWRRFVDDNFPGPPPGDALPEEETVQPMLNMKGRRIEKVVESLDQLAQLAIITINELSPHGFCHRLQLNRGRAGRGFARRTS